MKKFVLIFLSLIPLAHHVYAQHNIDYYTEKAINNSPLIHDNKNQIIANKYEVERLKAFYTKPQIGVTANYLFSPIISKDNGKTSFQANAEDASNYYGYDLAYSNGGIYEALLNVTQPLFNGRRYKTAAQKLNITSQIDKNSTKITKHDIEKIVTDQYILCLQDNKQMAYTEAIAKLIADQKDVLIKFVKNNIYKQSDLSLLDIEFDDFQSKLTTFKADYQRDLMDLNILCGVNNTSLVQIQDINLSPNSKIDHSNFLKKYRLDSLSLIAEQKVFELQYKPALNLFANTGLDAVYAPTIPNHFGISAGFTFTYHFFDGHQEAINRNRTKVLEESISFYRDNFITQNTVRKSKILTDLQSYSDRIAIAEQELKDYKILLNSYKKEALLSSGQFSIINYTTILKDMATVQQNYTLLFSKKQSLINAYNYWNW